MGYEGLKVIGAGFFRTGSSSLETALGTLGYRVYKLTNAWNIPGHMDAWEKVFDNGGTLEGIDADGLFAEGNKNADMSVIDSVAAQAKDALAKARLSAFGNQELLDRLNAIEANFNDPNNPENPHNTLGLVEEGNANSFAGLSDRPFDATLEMPALWGWKGLVEKYPEAKVILHWRDPDSWYESTKEILYPWAEIPPEKVPAASREYYRHTWHALWSPETGIFKGKFATDPEFAKSVYIAHYETVKATVPADRLLVYEMKDGWEPLCKLLGKELPRDKESGEVKRFPRVNGRLDNKKVLDEAFKHWTK